MKNKWLMIVFIFIAVVITFIIHENSSYAKATKSDDKVLELIKSELEKGKSAEEIKVYLETNRKTLDIVKVELYKDSGGSDKQSREHKTFAIHSTVFSWRAFNEGRQGPMLIDVDEKKKIVKRDWASM